jgi:thiol-disulfide isomerase/thioredoxin
MKKNILFVLLFQIYMSYGAKVYGTIENNTEDKGKIVKGKFLKEFLIDDKGNYEVIIDVEKEGLYTLYFDKIQIIVYLSNASNLEVSMDIKNNDKDIIFKGDGFEASQYLINRNKLYIPLYKDLTSLYSKTSEDFLSTIEKVIAENKELLQNTNNISENFIRLENKNINFTAQNWFKNYEMYHRYYTKKSAKNTKIIDEKIIKNFDYSIEDWEYSKEYVILIINQFNSNFYKQKESKRIEFLNAELQKIESESMQQSFLNNVSRSINTISDTNKKLLDYIVSKSNDQIFKDNLVSRYQKMTTFENGSVAPPFEYENEQGEKVSLASLLGKYVYIDFWATWCKPCVAEIPDLKKIEEKYKDKNIVFLSISLDDQKNKDKWKKFIKDREMHGIQLIVENAWSSKVVSDYVIEGIPKFVLIDKEGIIVEKSAPRPSSGKLEKILDKLLR